MARDATEEGAAGGKAYKKKSNRKRSRMSDPKDRKQNAQTKYLHPLWHNRPWKPFPFCDSRQESMQTAAPEPWRRLRRHPAHLASPRPRPVLQQTTQNRALSKPFSRQTPRHTCCPIATQPPFLPQSIGLGRPLITNGRDQIWRPGGLVEQLHLARQARLPYARMRTHS